YRDVVVAIDPDKKLNNGQPSAHARWIAAAQPRTGDAVMHLGVGNGYYTAILAEIVGPTGRVVAFEVEAAQVPRAREALSPWPHARVELGDGSAPGGSYDVIYLNCGATHARAEWLDALRDCGRLLI